MLIGGHNSMGDVISKHVQKQFCHQRKEQNWIVSHRIYFQDLATDVILQDKMTSVARSRAQEAENSRESKYFHRHFQKKKKIANTRVTAYLDQDLDQVLLNKIIWEPLNK